MTNSVTFLITIGVLLMGGCSGRPQLLRGGLLQNRQQGQGGLFQNNRQHGQGGPLGLGIIPALTHQQHHNQPQQQQPVAPAANDHAGTGGAASNPGLLGGVLGGLGGSATAGGAGQGSVSPDRVATGTGTGIAKAGPGGFGIGLGVGGAIATPFGDHTFGQGQSVAIGK